MRARAVNRQCLGQNTLRDLDVEYAAGGAASQSHAPRAVSGEVLDHRSDGLRYRVRIMSRQVVTASSIAVSASFYEAAVPA
jgi:hypothetical protein